MALIYHIIEARQDTQDMPESQTHVHWESHGLKHKQTMQKF